MVKEKFIVSIFTPPCYRADVADVGNPEFALQFGLLLELYCHGAVEHIDILIKQVEAINKMKTVTEILMGSKEQDVCTMPLE